MTDYRPNRDEAWDLLCEYTGTDSLRKHALAVEAAMRAYAERYGEDADAWGVVGLLHDFDYERWPDAENHPYRGAEILAERGFPEDWRRAIMSHASYTGIPRDSLMARVLFAVDELCGFVSAVTLVRPSKSIAEVDARAVRKKMKEKGFARSVNREEIVQGAAELGVELDAHIEFVISSLRAIADRIGLAGASS